jgi:F-type H+-transporting ATPase subunit gamma
MSGLTNAFRRVAPSVVRSNFGAVSALPLQMTQVRFASEKAIKERMDATANINKITETMKMVSSSKMKQDEARLLTARPYQSWVTGLHPAKQSLESFTTKIDELPDKNLFVLCTSDKGMCGAINSSMGRYMKALLPKILKKKKDVSLFLIGDKGRGQLAKAFSENITQCCTDSKAPYSYSLASAIAQDVSPLKADAVHIVFQKYVSAIAYEATVITLTPPDALKEEPYVEYEFEPDNKPELLEDMWEMSIATSLYTSMLETAASEQSSRMNAMENASKNGGELLKALSIEYNRARQARITTELCEIISGASALEG